MKVHTIPNWGEFSGQLEKSLPMIPTYREQHFTADTWQRGDFGACK